MTPAEPPAPAGLAEVPTLAALLAAVEAPLEAIASPEKRQRLQHLAAGLAFDRVPQVVFEVALGSDEGPLDVSFGSDRAGLAPVAAAVAAQPGAGEAWQRIDAFCRRDRSAAAPGAPRITSSWLEFDDAAGLPSLFFEFDNSGDQRQSLGPRGGAAFEALCDELQALSGQRPGADRQIAIEACAQALPPQAGVLGFGIMFARGQTDDVRFCVTSLPLAALADYLRQIGWPGDAAALQSALPRLPGYELSCRLAFDIGQRPAQRLGVELLAQPPDRFRSAQDWRCWLDAMHAAGHCTAGRLEALGRWLQADAEPAPVLRDISHLKLVFESHALRQIKAYPYARAIERLPLHLLQALAGLQAGY